jgi:hypothetical protein
MSAENKMYQVTDIKFVARGKACSYRNARQWLQRQSSSIPVDVRQSRQRFQKERGIQSNRQRYTEENKQKAVHNETQQYKFILQPLTVKATKLSERTAARTQGAARLSQGTCPWYPDNSSVQVFELPQRLHVPPW